MAIHRRFEVNGLTEFAQAPIQRAWVQRCSLTCLMLSR